MGGVVFIEHPLYAKHCNRHSTSIISLTFQTAPFISSVTNKYLLIVDDTWGTVQGAEDIQQETKQTKSLSWRSLHSRGRD